MPTVLRTSGFCFFFYSLEGSEPLHIHVEHGDRVAKFWLDPVIRNPDDCFGSSFRIAAKRRVRNP